MKTIPHQLNDHVEFTPHRRCELACEKQGSTLLAARLG